LELAASIALAFEFKQESTCFIKHLNSVKLGVCNVDSLLIYCDAIGSIELAVTDAAVSDLLYALACCVEDQEVVVG